MISTVIEKLTSKIIMMFFVSAFSGLTLVDNFMGKIT